MSSVPLSLLVFLIVCMASSTIQAQSDHPTLGVQLGNPGNGVDIVVAPSMAQCEPFLVYYNISAPVSPFIAFYTTDLRGDSFLTLNPPAGSAAGYIDWICNIPAGYSLIVATRDDTGVLRGEFYVVQPGLSSSCLIADVTATYSIANYGTKFQAFTSSDILRETAPFTAASVTIFPTESLSTITANPNLADASTTIVSPTPTGSRNKLIIKDKVAFALGIAGWILIIGFLALCLYRLGRASRAKRILHDKQYESVSHSDSNDLSSTLHSAQHSVNNRSAPNTATATTPFVQMSERSAVLGHQAHGSSANASNSGGDPDLEASQLTSSQLPIPLAHLIASNVTPSATSEQPLSTPSQVLPNAVQGQVRSAIVEAVPDTTSPAQPSATEMGASGVNVDQSTRVGVTDQEILPQPTTF